MSEIEKPRRKPGSTCPLWRKDVSQVCHTCEWYDELPLDEINPDGSRGKTFGIWGCALVRLVKVGRDAVAAMDGTQAAVENFRNNVWEANRLSLALQVREGRELLAKDAAPQIEAKTINGGD